jgi:hypothetical protein
MLFELRDTGATLREWSGRACLWRWEIARFKLRNESSYNILYAGRKMHREMAKVLLGADRSLASSYAGAGQLSSTVLVSEMPIPVALCVPHYLRVIIQLGRPIAEIAAEFGEELRRVIRQRRMNYRLIQMLDDTGIENADRKMLQPYAKARHGPAVSHLDSDEVLRLAARFGWFHLLLLDGEEVACQLGGEITRAKKRYWTLFRCGYPESVFSISKKLHETNSINFYLALECAIENNFDYFDLGSSLGRPEDGLLQWKKRWRGSVDTMGNHGFFHVRLPAVGKPRFLWDSPLFAIEQDNLSLHLGLPIGKSDEEVVSRYREMGFDGLHKVYLYCARPCGEELLEKLRNLYVRQNSPPILELIYHPEPHHKSNLIVLDVSSLFLAGQTMLNENSFACCLSYVV